MYAPRTLLACFFLLSICFFVTPAAAQGEGGEAEACYERGQRYYDLKKYPEAIKEFEEGYLLSGLPAFLLNIAQAYRMQGDLPRAADYYRRFLDRGDPDDPAREGAKAVLLEIEGGPPKEPVLAPSPDEIPREEPTPQPVYDGGLSQEEIKGMLGERYPNYLASGLSLKGFQVRKKGRLILWLGAGALGGGLLLAALVDRDEVSPDVPVGLRQALQVGSIVAISGGLGAISVGGTVIKGANALKRPSSVRLALAGYPGGAGFVISF